MSNTGTGPSKSGREWQPLTTSNNQQYFFTFGHLDGSQSYTLLISDISNYYYESMSEMDVLKRAESLKLKWAVSNSLLVGELKNVLAGDTPEKVSSLSLRPLAGDGSVEIQCSWAGADMALPAPIDWTFSLKAVDNPDVKNVMSLASEINSFLQFVWRQYKHEKHIIEGKNYHIQKMQQLLIDKIGPGQIYKPMRHEQELKDTGGKWIVEPRDKMTASALREIVHDVPDKLFAEATVDEDTQDALVSSSNSLRGKRLLASPRKLKRKRLPEFDEDIYG